MTSDLASSILLDVKKRRRARADVAAVELRCGYCREPWTVIVDPTGGAAQSYVEDCSVCCRPNRIEVSVDEDGEVSVRAAFEG